MSYNDITEMICKICKNSASNTAYQIREMMFGFRDAFTYFECSECGCLQITEVPNNMERYYSSNYYSLRQRGSVNLMGRFILNRRDKYVLSSDGFIGKLFYRLPIIMHILLRGSHNIILPWVFDEKKQTQSVHDSTY